MARDRDLAGVPVYCSWSGGKDAAMALHEATLRGAEPGVLVTMMTGSGQRSRSHGLRRDLLERQAAAIGLPITFAATSWAGYEEAFRSVAAGAVADGFATGVHGDLDVEGHRSWVESVTASVNATAVLPLWHRDRRRFMHEVLDRGFRAVIVAVRDGVLSPSLLGEVVDANLLTELARAGVDPAGENGEYHTVVVDGPSFRHPLSIGLGEVSLREGVWFIDLT